MLRRFLTIGLVLWVGAAPAPAQEMEFFTVGSGGVLGGYFSAARAICDVVNRREEGELRCSPDPTPGSIYNLAGLERGDLDFALVQSDWQRLAYEGAPPFQDAGAFSEMRSVMSLYPEYLSILVSAQSDLESSQDIIGARIEIGEPGSGRRATIDRMLAGMGLGLEDFDLIEELPIGGAIEALCDGRIDATVLVIGHPNRAVDQAIRDCDARLVPARGPLLDTLFAEGLDVTRATIAARTYPDQERAIPTYAVTATLVTTTRADDGAVTALVQDTLSSLRLLAVRAPVLQGLEPEAMRSRGLTAPLHPAAEAAFEAAASQGDG